MKIHSKHIQLICKKLSVVICLITTTAKLHSNVIVSKFRLNLSHDLLFSNPYATFLKTFYNYRNDRTNQRLFLMDLGK